MKPEYDEETQGEPGKDNASDYPGTDAQQPNPRFLFEREKEILRPLSSFFIISKWKGYDI